MSDESRLVAVKATKREYYGLRHPATQEPLDEHGEGLWPRDQNTFRLFAEHALKEIEPNALRSRAAAEEPAPAEADQPAFTRTKKG